MSEKDSKNAKGTEMMAVKDKVEAGNRLVEEIRRVAAVGFYAAEAGGKTERERREGKTAAAILGDLGDRVKENLDILDKELDVNVDSQGKIERFKVRACELGLL